MLSETESNIADAFASQGQAHVLRHANTLTATAREALFAQLAQIDLELLARLIAGGGDEKVNFATLSPSPYIALGSDGGHVNAGLRQSAAMLRKK